MNDYENNLEQILGEMTFDDCPEQSHEDLLRQKLILNFNAVQAQHDSKWRIIMNKQITKYAAAAVLLIGLCVGSQFFKNTEKVSWADVLDRVSMVKAVSYQAEVTSYEGNEPFTMQIEAVQTDDFGTKMDIYVGKQLANTVYSLVAEQAHITLFPDQNKFIKVELTDEILQQNGNPKTMVDAFLKGPYKELGRSEIDGIVVEGIESDNISPAAGFPGGGTFLGSVESEFSIKTVGRLWVDVSTGWPVKVTLEFVDPSSQGKASFCVSHFQWNAQVDSDVFASVIPDGYSMMYTIKAGQLESGQQLIDGLAYYAQLSGGRYPAALTVRDVVGDIGTIYREKSGEPGFSIDDGQVVNLKYGAQYFVSLEEEGREPVYYGKSVTASDTDNVLLRWTLDDGTYRVIYGDLRIEDVDESRLSELEDK